LRDVRLALAQARGRQKIDLLLEAPDPQALIRALPPEELYFALLEAGSDDAAEVIALASPEQFRTFIDLAAWPKSDEGPRPQEIVRWLRLSREGNSRDVDRFREQLAGLDRELLALLIRREVKVHELTEDVQPSPENPGLAHYTPDRRFLLEFQNQQTFEAMRQIFEDLYAEDAYVAGNMLESARWEVPTELEENARHWRDARLRDLGVPTFEEALSFYARPASRVEPVPPSSSTALTVPGRPLLDEALAKLNDEELEQAEESIAYAANSALVANRTPMGDSDEVREQLLSARGTLSLGLELLSGGDPEKASRVLVEQPVREIFQTAMGEVYRLQTRARQIAKRARLPEAQSVTLIDEPLESALQALLVPRPKLHEPGKRRPRTFASRADLELAAKLLDQAEGLLALLHQLGLAPEKLGPLAEAAGLGPAALKASGAISAFIESQLFHRDYSLTTLTEENHARPPGFAEKARELVPEPYLSLLKLA
jgi:hypothetical protein